MSSELEVKRIINRAWTSRGFELVGAPYVSFNDIFTELHAEQHFEQYKRLSTNPPHPLEQGYGRVQNKLNALTEVYNAIAANCAICLTSEGVYLRKFAELITLDLRDINNE